MKRSAKKNPTQERGKGVSQNDDEGTFQDDNPQESQKLPVQNKMENEGSRKTNLLHNCEKRAVP